MIAALFLRVALLSSAESVTPAASPEGVWETVDDSSGHPRSLVRIAIRNLKLTGVVEQVILRPDEGQDPICLRCRGPRHGQRIVGMQILWDHRPQGDRWVDGTIMDPENGKEYGSTVWLEGPDRLRVRGYWGPFYRTQTWRRVAAMADAGWTQGAPEALAWRRR